MSRSKYSLSSPLLAGALTAALVLAAGPATGEDDGAPRQVPAYTVPSAVQTSDLPDRLRNAVTRAIRTLEDPASPADSLDAARLVASIGAPALGDLVAALRSAPWPARAALVGAVAEMDETAVTPLLTAAARDPSFAVREAAVTGLGKIGDERSAEALFERADPATERVWRVRKAVAPALRRAVLRGVVDRTRGQDTLLTMIRDPDRDVRLAALSALGPLAAPRALEPLLDLYAALQEDRESPREERALVLDALRAYRTQHPALLAVLADTFRNAEPQDAVNAARALFALRGVAALDDESTTEAALRHLMEEQSHQMWLLLAELGPDTAPWLRFHAERLALRMAAHRAVDHESQFTQLTEILIRVDETAGVDFLLWILEGKDAGVLDPGTRRFAVEKAERGFAARMGGALRRLFASRSGRDIRVVTLRAVAKSGGDDLAQILDDALVHEDGAVVAEAMRILGRRSDVPVGTRLVQLARQGATPRVRLNALRSLGRRSPARAAELALESLDDPVRDLRMEAVTILSGVQDPAHFDALLGRLAREDGSDPGDRPRRPDPPQDDGSGDEGTKGPVLTEGSGSSRARVHRRGLRRSLLQAMRTADPKRARPVLLEAVASEEEASVRTAAARALLGTVEPTDAPALLAVVSNETDESARDALVDVLASLDGSPEAVRHFERLAADPAERLRTLARLRVRTARIVPSVVEGGVADPSWTEEARESALAILERADRLPDEDVLAKIVRTAHTVGLSAEAVRVLAAKGGARASAALLELLGTVDDRDTLTEVVRRLGETGAQAASPSLRALLDRTRARAMSAPAKVDADFALYEATAVALARCGGEGGSTLVRHLFHPDLVYTAGRLSALRGGPFKPVESATVHLVGTLVRALAHLSDKDCVRLVEAHLAELAADGRDRMLHEGYVEGIARYLDDPTAHGLPPRRRPDTALLLRSLVPRLAPRMSPLDGQALRAMPTRLASQGRYAEAVETQRAYIRFADVERAARTGAARRYEQGKLQVLRARRAAKEGRPDDAKALLATVREADPADDDLAFLAGYGRAKAGFADAQARKDLLFKVARDHRHPQAAFWLGWVTQALDGPVAAIPRYAQAMKLDTKAVQDSRGQYRTSRDGRTHEWSHYPYFLARAYAAAGRVDDARQNLAEAVSRDDRDAAAALRDPVLRGLPDLQALVDASLARIRH